ncbi:MAG: F0F1 ATP synthase subunit A [bacterium]|nr:F0F1 ATP synthase subunit A [bacterium]
MIKRRLGSAALLATVLAPTLTYASDGGTHLPDVVGMLTHDETISLWKPVIFSFALAVLFSIAAVRVYAKRELLPGRFQNVMEMLVEGMFNFLETILGKDAKKYTPFLGTLFFYILGMNFLGIIPLGFSPSTSINVTASLAILVFLYAQWTGITRLGIVGYFDHLAGQPRDVISWCLVPLMFPMHLIGEIAKPFSLALRLFGNITGEDILVAAFVGLGISLMALFGWEHGFVLGVPLNIPFILLGILLSTIQALVFTLLSTIYILMMLPHEEAH